MNGGAIMTKFEYKTIITSTTGLTGRSGNFDDISFEKEINKLGLEGWELVTHTPSARDDGSTKLFITIFKRCI